MVFVSSISTGFGEAEGADAVGDLPQLLPGMGTGVAGPGLERVRRQVLETVIERRGHRAGHIVCSILAPCVARAQNLVLRLWRVSVNGQ
jgi:hypothetical protein